MESSSSVSVSDDDEHVILVITNPDPIQTETESPNEEILLSTTDILIWDFPTIFNFHTIKVHAHRDRLIEQSSYFRSLLSGSFSESCLGSITIKWNVRVFIQILKHICDCPLDITFDTFLPLYEGALYFGVETLLLKCQMWFSEVSSPKGFQSTQIQMEDLIQIWKFGLEHASDFILDLCMGYLARNFMWAMHSKFFGKIPHDMLLSSVKHHHLTVDSEMHLSDALLLWLGSNMESLENPSNAEDSCNGILKQIRVGLLPLWFAAGKRNSFHFRHLAEESLDSIFRLLNIPTICSQDTLGYSELQHLRIRLTEYSKKVDLSDCPQITSAVLLVSLIPSSYLTDPTRKKIIEHFFINSGHSIRDRRALRQRQLQTFTFEAVQEVDISKCQRLLIEHAVDCFCKSFPSLRMLKATYLLNIKTTSFLQLLEKCPLVCEIDLTVDITPVIPALVTVLSSSPAVIPLVPEKTSSVEYKAVEIMLFNKSGPPLSNVTKLTLEGRTDVGDLVLQYISKLCVSLRHLNIKGCISATDIGISDLIRRCKKLNSIVVCDTSFGISSVQALSSATSDGGSFSSLHSGDKYLNSVASNLQTLHMGGCRGICESSLLELMSQTQVLKSLCLRETDLVDQALYNFVGSSLEMLDVSNTKISGAALAYVIHGNPNLKCLKARDCRNLFQEESSIEKREPSLSSLHEELHAELEKMRRLEEIEFGWGFSTFSLRALEPALMSLKTVNVGLGGMLGEDALRRLPAICPLLETMILHFQECGEVTANGVSALLDCKALEDILLRHNGPGLPRNFIFYAASEMPLLRKLSLDICDAREGDFDIPNYADRYFLSTLKIARCKSQTCAFNLPVPAQGSRRRSVHVETLVLAWNSRDLIRTVVKERL